MAKVTSIIVAVAKNDVVVRAVKTFVQASVATWVAGGQQVNKSAIIGAVAGGISAVWNFIRNTV